MRTPDFSMILAVRLFNEARPDKFKKYYNILLRIINNSFVTPFKTQIEKKYLSIKLPVNVIPKKYALMHEMRYCEISKEDTPSKRRITERRITERQITECRITECRITERRKLPNVEYYKTFCRIFTERLVEYYRT